MFFDVSSCLAALAGGWYERVVTGARESLQYRLKIGFRSRDVCDPQNTFQAKIGDVLFVANQRGLLDMQIPLTAASASRKGWVAGACISKMVRTCIMLYPVLTSVLLRERTIPCPSAAVAQ
jgi:hypothetical protein